MRILLTKQADKYFEKCPANLRDRLEKAIIGLLDGEGDIKPLLGYPGFFRLRVGSYRILFSYEINPDTLVIQKIGSRGDVYKIREESNEQSYRTTEQTKATSSRST
jgi:mRNA interferase RelE/StbE